MLRSSSLAICLALTPPAAAAVVDRAPLPTSYVAGLLDEGMTGPSPTPGPLTRPGATLQRLTEPTYADGFDAPTASPRPSPRTVLNRIDRPENARTTPPMTNLGVVMMQLFASHEIAHTLTLDGDANRFDLEIAGDDPIAVAREGRFVMPMQRSRAVGGSGPGDVREQLNSVTAAFDGSIVYGSTAAATARLRRHDGSGKLSTGPNGSLPVVDGRPTAGDARADENRLLQAGHTLFLREHNRLADEVSGACADLGVACSGDFVFNATRRLVTAQTQRIVYGELLPAFLGTADLASLLPDPSLLADVHGAINEATTAALRVGHSQVPNSLVTIDPAGQRREVPLDQCFFRDCLAGVPLDDILRGAAAQAAAPVDTVFAEALRDAQVPGADATFVVDLPGTSTRRADDHGLGGYLALRAALGLPEMPLDALLPPPVLEAYRDENGDLLGDIPIFIGAIAEEPLAGAQVGPLAAAVHALQFAALRLHDPDFYDKPGVFDAATRAWLEKLGLREVILANTDIRADELPGDLYLTPLPGALPLAATALGLLGFFRRRAAA